eukprot:2801393-Rhodomonas_salina.1
MGSAEEELKPGLAASLGIQWFFLKGKKWEPFDYDANDLLEEAHVAGENEVAPASPVSPAPGILFK